MLGAEGDSDPNRIRDAPRSEGSRGDSDPNRISDLTSFGFVPISDLRSEREALRSDKSERSENYIESTECELDNKDNIENELQELESVSEENDTMLELETFED